MNFEGFLSWLTTDKNLSERAAKDTVSRLRRALRLISKEQVTETTTNELNKAPGFIALSRFVKSQLRRSVALYEEYIR